MYKQPELKWEISRTILETSGIGMAFFGSVVGVYAFLHGLDPGPTTPFSCSREFARLIISENKKPTYIESLSRAGCKRLEVRAATKEFLDETQDYVNRARTILNDPDLDIEVDISDRFLGTGDINNANKRVVIIYAPSTYQHNREK